VRSLDSRYCHQSHDLVDQAFAAEETYFIHCSGFGGGGGAGALRPLG
jgi:hypothetical protein